MGLVAIGFDKDNFRKGGVIVLKNVDNIRFVANSLYRMVFIFSDSHWERVERVLNEEGVVFNYVKEPTISHRNSGEDIIRESTIRGEKND